MYDHRQSVKEVIRHVLFGIGLNDTLDMLRLWRGQNTEHMRAQDMTNVFSQIYANDVWGTHENYDSLSGAGSTQAATCELAVQLSAFLRDVGCRYLVDIGCGDFNWMRNVEGEFEYLGIDVVPRVIDANNKTHANDRRRFVCMDATLDGDQSGVMSPCVGGLVPFVVSRWTAIVAQYQGRRI